MKRTAPTHPASTHPAPTHPAPTQPTPTQPPSASGTPAAPAAPGPRRPTAVRPPGPQTALAVLFLLALVPLCLRLPWAGDQGLHTAVIGRLAAHLTDPGNPLVRENTPSPYYSPWMLLLAAVRRLTGLPPRGVLSLAAITGCTLLVSGVYRFVRTLTEQRWAPVLALPLVVLLWGWQVFTWSGWVELTSLTLTLCYPSTLALGLALHLWAWLQREARAGWRPLPTLALGALGALVLLVHQFTGAVGLLGAAAVVMAAPSSRSARALLRLAVAVAVLAALLAAWPYYDFWKLLSVGDLESIHRNLYRDLLPRYGLALLALPALVARARRHRLRDPLVLLPLLGAAVFTAGGLTGHWSWGRVWPAVMLPAQLALAVEVTGLAAGRWRRAAGAVVATALAVGAWTQLGVAGYLLPGHEAAFARAEVDRIPAWGDDSWAAPYVHPGETVLTRDYYALRMIPALGAYTVAPAYPDPFLPDEQQRRRDTYAFFDRDTPAGCGKAILLRYHVGWIIKSPDEGPVPADPLYATVATGPHGERLVRVRLPAPLAAPDPQHDAPSPRETPGPSLREILRRPCAEDQPSSSSSPD
ncbi:hypothetical protein ACIQGZ_13255 [Streptomyces sp. NPDC092296]|uniref:hypothetical protein n=1 Tax=Streptomyces sp. NPDC092296 TaxID=3366012 RepID=UPI003802D554